MADEAIKVLLVEDDDTDAFLVERLLARARWFFELERCCEIAELAGRAGGDWDVCLLDLGLPDSRGLETLDALLACTRDLPVVVLTGERDNDLGVQAIERGAQDFLSKGERELESLARALRYAVERHRLERELKRAALHDDLTDLPNRRLFEDRFLTAVHRAERTRSRFALVYMDLDEFKAINDRFGHPAGDRVLTTVAARLQHSTRRTDTVARLGGDEFALLLEDVADLAAAEAVCDSIRRAATAPCVVDGGIAQVRLSAGLAVYPDQGRSLTGLSRAADRALYAAKRGGRAQTRVADVPIECLG